MADNRKSQRETDIYLVYLTKQCNLACTYCYETNKTNEHMTEETLKETIDYIMAQHEDDPEILVKYMFFGGEALLNWKVVLYGIDYLYNEYYLKQGRKIAALLTTNGTLLTKSRVKELFKYNKIFNIEVSIDGDQETHDSCRQLKNGMGSYNMLMKNIPTILQYFPFATARIVVTNVDKHFDNVVHLYNLGFKKFCLQALRYTDGRTHDNYYVDKFASDTEKIKEFLSSKKFTYLDAIEYPLTEDKIEDRKVHKEEGYFNYFLPSGGHIKQEKFVENGFQHFSKGVDASYNLLKQEEHNES